MNYTFKFTVASSVANEFSLRAERKMNCIVRFQTPGRPLDMETVPIFLVSCKQNLEWFIIYSPPNHLPNLCRTIIDLCIAYRHLRQRQNDISLRYCLRSFIAHLSVSRGDRWHTECDQSSRSPLPELHPGLLSAVHHSKVQHISFQVSEVVKVRSCRRDWLVTWFCYQMIIRPGTPCTTME